MHVAIGNDTVKPSSPSSNASPNAPDNPHHKTQSNRNPKTKQFPPLAIIRRKLAKKREEKPSHPSQQAGEAFRPRECLPGQQDLEGRGEI